MENIGKICRIPFQSSTQMPITIFMVVVKARLAAAESGPRQDRGNCDLRT